MVWLRCSFFWDTISRKTKTSNVHVKGGEKTLSKLCSVTFYYYKMTLWNNYTLKLLILGLFNNASQSTQSAVVGWYMNYELEAYWRTCSWSDYNDKGYIQKSKFIFFYTSENLFFLTVWSMVQTTPNFWNRKKLNIFPGFSLLQGYYIPVLCVIF
jgi:hypothetical protein